LSTSLGNSVITAPPPGSSTPDTDRTASKSKSAGNTPSLVVVEQLVTPVDRAAQRAVPRQSGTGAGREQLEALVEMLHKLSRPEAAHPSGGQLDRQWQPVEPLAQRRHGRCDGVGERKAG
jgi:hypothetical protein